jgi:O-antigen ligase
MLGTMAIVVLALLLVPAAAFLVARTGPDTLVSLGVASQILNGNADLLGLPVAPDRLLILAGLGWLAIRNRPERLKITGVHLMLLTTSSIGIISALWADTFRTPEGFFGLLDKLGIVPFVLFALAPLLYRSADERRRLLIIMTVVGGYLSTTAFLEYFDQTQLLFPSYIGDPDVGIHFGRARGPFLESVAMGIGLLMVAILMYVAQSAFRTRVGRRAASIVGLACMLATVLTLTRAVWLAAVVVVVVLLAVDPRARRRVVLVVPLGVLAVVLLFALVPQLNTTVSERAAEQEPLWDRLNTNDAAIAIVKDRPWMGIGWGTFPTRSAEYMRLRDDIPLTGAGIDVHNVPLSNAAELGLLGGGFWLATLLAAIGGALLKPTIPEFRIWRYGALAVAAAWFTVAMFGPLSYPLANSLLWLSAGIVATPRALMESPTVEEKKRPTVGARS